MQYRSEQTYKLTKKLGEIIKRLRMEKYDSIQKFADEFDINRSNCSRIENAKADCKLISFYKIAQALGIKPSELLKMLEDELGADFSLIDE